MNCLKVPNKVKPVGNVLSAERGSHRARGKVTRRGVLDGFPAWIASDLSLRRQVDGQDAPPTHPKAPSGHEQLWFCSGPWAGNLKI